MEPMTRVPAFTLGDRLRKAREVAGLTQSDLAAALGIGRRSVSRYEDGDQEPKRGVVMAWSMATSVPLEWLLTGQIPDNLLVTGGYPEWMRFAA